MFDVAIIGAGPAGATLARLLGRRLKIALFEKRDLESVRPDSGGEKCCGGLLAPDAQKALATLSLGLPRALTVDPQLFAVRSIDLAAGRERCYQRHYLNLDRPRFDRWLYSLVPPGVVRFSPSLVTGLSPGPRAYILRYRQAGREYSLEARLVVGADGARSLVRSRLCGGREPARRYLAIEEWFAWPAGAPFYSALFDPTVTDYYAWTIPKNGELIVGAALDPKRDPVGRFALLKRKLQERGLALSRPLKKRSAFLLRPRGPASVMTGADGLALAGEASGLVSPSSGEGISFALESAAQLAFAILRHGPAYQKPYRRSVAGLRRKVCLKNLKAPFLYCPPLRRAVMALGVRSVRLKDEWGGAGGETDAAAERDKRGFGIA